jgi:GntR family transcriptional regulator
VKQQNRQQVFKRSPVPFYIQVAMLLRNRISDGLYSPGQKMPTQEELEQEFGVARVTVRQAVELLEKEGLVQRQQGRGTFVARQTPERRWLHLTMDINALAETVASHVPRFIAVKRPPAVPLHPGDEAAADAYQYLLSV